jgi:hypothetical protein
MAWRFTSPRLSKDDSILRECPVGAVLREAPHVYDAIAAESYVESGAIDPTTRPMYLQQAIAVISAERGRLHEIRRERERSASDASYGARVLKHGNR